MSYTDNQLKTLTIQAGLRNESNMMVNSRGVFYAGQQWKTVPMFVTDTIKRIVKARFAVILNPTRVDAGLAKGASDNVGITTITITPDMVGQKIGVFTAIENKSLKDRWQKGQKEFLQMVADAGGMAAEHREVVEEEYTEFRWVSSLRWPEK